MRTFWNTSSKSLDRASFTFPLPAGCAVSNFTCDFGHHGGVRSIASKVRPRDAARFAFEQSAQAKRPTGLLEQNSTEAFTASIGNIAGHGRLRTHLTYFGYLRSTFPGQGGTVQNLTLTIPSSIAKRYGVPPPQFQGRGQQLTPLLTEYNIHVLHPGRTSFVSNQKIRTSRLHDSWLVSYARVHSPPGDFELCIRSSQDAEQGQAFFQATDGSAGHQFAMMITIPPKQIANTEPTAAQSDIIFLADRSGSMDDKICALKKAMNVFLKALRAVDSSLDATSMVDIIVLTDGEVWDLDSTATFVKQRTEASLGMIRFFALGIGTEVSHGLVGGIAKYGGGYSEVIQGTNPTIYAERLNAMLCAANVKHVNSIHIEVDGNLLSQSTDVFQTAECYP